MSFTIFNEDTIIFEFVFSSNIFLLRWYHQGKFPGIMQIFLQVLNLFIVFNAIQSFDSYSSIGNKDHLLTLIIAVLQVRSLT